MSNNYTVGDKTMAECMRICIAASFSPEYRLVDFKEIDKILTNTGRNQADGQED